MAKILQLVLFTISNLLIFGILLALIIKYYYGFSEFKYIWFCSKILTVKKMITKNNNQDIVFSHYYNGDTYAFTKLHYLDYLERIDKNGCLENYKKCGILDTYGNSICFPQSTECPINDMIFESSTKLSEYQNNNYDYYYTDINNIYLYFKRGVENKPVIVSHLIQNSKPRYINDNNFVFDMDAFKEIFGDSDYDDDDDDDDDDDFNFNDDDDDDNDKGSEAGKEILEGTFEFAGDLIKNAAKAARINQLIKYIDERINEDENNIDNNYEYINLNHYVKNYIGFENLETAKNFKTINFELYKSRYPNYSSIIFALICGLIFLFLTVMNIIFIIFTIKDNGSCEGCRKGFFVISIIAYCLTFLGFFIYSVYTYSKVFKNEEFEKVKNIKADKFIENFLKEFYEPFENSTFIFCIIIALALSAILFILSFILGPLIECIKNKKSNGSYYSYRRNIYDNQRNININQRTIPYNAQYNNIQQTNQNNYQSNTTRKLDNGVLDTNINTIGNNNNIGVNNEQNLNEIQTEENNKKDIKDNPIIDFNELII